MLQNKKSEGDGQKPQTSTPTASVPAISLPKGGGALRGIDEKFAANPVTGTGSMTVPLATSPGRSEFGPQLSLAYDSGAGNGPFGLGWNLSLPNIMRKTDKGLPQYRDAAESDVFVLSGAEDLVPVLVKNGDEWQRDSFARTVDGRDYRIARYRPRIEGLFARIERWTRVENPEDVHWRSISNDNILTIYGQDANARIADPENPGRIFTWLICETRDDKGNAVIYRHKEEDGIGVDLAETHERNRGDRDDPRRTANRYLKRILYGNRVPLLDDEGQRPSFLSDAQIQDENWMFEVVFDYGEHDADAPTPNDAGAWAFRDDPFSTYRAGFEVRTTRLCRRVLMFHHFEHETGVGKDCLVRATDFSYSHEPDPDHARNPVYTLLLAVTQTGYRRDNSGYLKRSLPPVEFEYTQPVVQDTVEAVDPASLENLPMGLDGTVYQWTDLHGEGIPGILTEQGGAWLYKRNLSPVNGVPRNGVTHTAAKFAPVEVVAAKPNLTLSGGAQFMDIGGDGQPDLVVMDDPSPGLYEHDGEQSWLPFRPFTSRLTRDTRDPNLRFVDLNGDGHPDVLISEENAFVWHPSLAEDGFGPAQRVQQALDEEKGPRLVFAEGTESVYLADLSGDGLTDLARIRNGEVCYWPNLGYGRFGAKITMDHAPWFDNPDQFDQQRIRLADIDGTGTADIIYLHREGVRLYFDQSGNGWSEPVALKILPPLDNLAAVTVVDLLGNGTACLVWSSHLPGDAGRQMRYVNLMGSRKPHLLVKTTNNLGAETRVQYAPSTKFYLQDKRDGRPWITRLPFPVHVVEQVTTYDHISRNRFVTRYQYHHGYFDGEEREFHGFGMVEQFDTEEFAALSSSIDFPTGDNIDAASHVPPVHTKTWFHTGAFIDRHHISRQFEDEYYREPGLTDPEFQALLLPDTTLPTGLTLEEAREACRALKGMMLRQEVYADDAGPEATEAEIQRAATPYTVVEQDFTIRPLQPRAGNRHAVFFTHPREAITYHYERNPTDPRIQHALTLEVDDFGNVLREAAIGYGRREMIRVVDHGGEISTLPNPGLHELDTDDQQKQTGTLITYTENRVTNAVETEGAYRTPLPCATRTYELTGFQPENNADRFSFAEWTRNGFALPMSATEIPYEQAADNVSPQKRLVEHVRTLFRKDDLRALLPLGELEPLALPGESYQLAFTPGLLAHVYRRPLDAIQPPGAPVPEELLPEPADVLPLGPAGEANDRGGYVDLDGNGQWWMPTGRIFLSPTNDAPADELAHARRHFFLPHRHRDPFHTAAASTESFISYDAYDLLTAETRDALDNRIIAENDYRVLQSQLVTDPNGNRTQVAFDILGMVVGTAVMGKAQEAVGDSLADFEADLPAAVALEHLANPLDEPHAILQQATTRLVYDFFAYQRTKHTSAPQPAVVYTLARETHDSDLEPGQQTHVQHSFAYSDGFGREIQQKIQAAPGPVPTRDDEDTIIVGPDGQPEMTDHDVSPRWVGSGWTVFNNKEDPVREYEPFFTDTHRFEFDVRIGVSPVLFYDPVERVVATLHPNHTWEKVVFDAWRQETWDVNDTARVVDPATDPDVGDFFRRLPEDEYLLAWHALRTDSAHADEFAARYPDAAERDNETRAAEKAAIHAETPTVAHADALSRTFLTLAHNRFERDDSIVEEQHPTRVELDIQGNERAVIDAQGRMVMRYAYDMLGNRIHQASMEAGERWMLDDVTGNPIRAWDSREHAFRTAYDPLRRPVESYMRAGTGDELLVERTVYGETLSNPEANNLRGQVIEVFDQAGVLTTDAYDFKENLLASRRQLAQHYTNTLDWLITPALESESFSTRTAYDALDRPLTITTPDGSVYRPTFNAANLLEQVDVNLRGTAAAERFVENIDYNAKGQRVLAEFGNGVRTTYEYDPLTFRLVHLQTRRDAERLQDLFYTYDPVGNITHIRDDAQQIIYFDNSVAEPHADYTYDARYRLLKATGREHIGQAGQSAPSSWDDALRVNLPHPHSGEAMRPYTERYEYDSVGNILRMIHAAPEGNWTRNFAYDETSQLEPTEKSNRLRRTTVGNVTESYEHDVHGNMTTMPHLSLMEWDYRDQLQATAQQVVNHDGTAETTYYVYDAAGQRVRKVTERQTAAEQAPRRKEERIYLGGFELYRAYNGNGDTVTLERETLHIMDDEDRIALVETRTLDTAGSDPASEQLIRYQFGNHLGSASLELDHAAQIISYEEYTPYGSTSYQAVRNETETPKRYRYTGKERDEETGLNYHGARYYAPWLGRWTSCDPQDSLNLYVYGKQNPIFWIDPSGNDDRPAHRRALSWIGRRASDAVEGSQIITEGISRGAENAGNWVQDRTQSGARWLEERGNRRLATGLKWIGIGAATTTYTVTEVGGQFLAIGPNMVQGLDTAGTNIGEGLGRATYGEHSDERWLGIAQAAGGIGQGALTALEVLSLSSGRQIARQSPVAGPGESQQQANRRLGSEFESRVAQRETSVTTDVSQQLRIQPMQAASPNASGPSVVPAVTSTGQPLIVVVDIASRSRITGRLRLSEAKSTATAPLTPNQQRGFPLIEQHGGIVRSRQPSVLDPLRLGYGDRIGPQSTSIIRNTGFGNQYLYPTAIAGQSRQLTLHYFDTPED